MTEIELRKENDELKAHVHELRDFVERIYNTYQFQHGRSTENVFGITAKLLLDTTPEQSLKRLEADAIERMLNHLDCSTETPNGDDAFSSNEIYDYANSLKQEI